MQITVTKRKLKLSYTNTITSPLEMCLTVTKSWSLQIPGSEASTLTFCVK